MRNRINPIKLNNKAFTLVEMIVVIAILSIILGVSAWGTTGYILHSQYLKNEGNAQTMYLAAQSALSAADSRGTLDELMEEIEDNSAVVSGDAVKERLGFPTSKDNEKVGHKYAYITVNAGDYNAGVENEAISVIRNYVYDTDTLNGAYAIEFDLTSQTVYGVFYSAWADGFSYTTGESAARGTVYIDSSMRPTEKRYSLAVGYYGVDQVNVANLGSANLKLLTAELNNEETLNLKFRSNSTSQELDAKYNINVYQQMDGESTQNADASHLVFSTSVQYSDIAGGTRTDSTITARTELAVTFNDGTTENVPFIISYDGRAFKLVLDGYTTSLSNALVNKVYENGVEDYNSLSVARLTGTLKPENLFAEIMVIPTEEAAVLKEYSVGNGAITDTENDMFATDENLVISDSKDEISNFRHLSNVRLSQEYREENSVTDAHTYDIIEDLDWSNSEMYDISGYIVDNITSPSGAIEAGEFPSLETLDENSTINGQGKTISNLTMNDTSVVDLGEYSDGDTSVKNSAKALGLVGENEGKIKNIAFSNSSVTVGSADASADSMATSIIYTDALDAVGLLTGRNSGAVSGIYMDEDCQVEASLTYRASSDKSGDSDVTTPDGQGIGLLAGTMLLDSDTDIVDRVELEGKVSGHITGTDSINEFTMNTISEKDYGYIHFGVGGVAGYIHETKSSKGNIGYTAETVAANAAITDYYNDDIESNMSDMDDRSVVSKAEVTGDCFLGGIVGNVYSDLTYADYSDSSNTSKYVLRNCHNEGQVLVSENPDADSLENMEKESPTFDTLTGLYSGGVVGYLNQARIYECSDSLTDKKLIKKYNSDGAGDYIRNNTSKGVFVGGIAGFSYDGTMYSCETNDDCYITGYDYVGGIAGSLKSEITMGGGSDAATGNILIVGDTVNAAYVAGHSFIGGIVGKNTAGSTIKNVINKGIAAGYGIDIGGITGINQGEKIDGSVVKARVINCGSSLNDYGNKVYNLIKDKWKFFGSNVGGQVGFNEYGTIEFDNEKTSSKMVSSTVVGKNNVGGLVGYNGINGELSLKNDGEYVAGKVYGAGDCVGGYIGFNLSPEALTGQIITVSCVSVKGDKLVGGVVGANILEISKSEDAILDISYDNNLSTIEGNSIVGGCIGYNLLTTNAHILPSTAVTEDTGFNYGVDSDQWTENFLKTDADSNTYSLISSDLEGVTVADGQKTLKINEKSTFVIGDESIDSNAADYERDIYNNAEVKAVTYGGGIVGMNSAYSHMLIANAENAGAVTEAEGDKIDVKKLTGIEDELSSGLLGGIIGHASVRTVIDSCANSGDIELLSGGYGSICGLNEGYILNCENAANIGNSKANIVGGIAGINFVRDFDEGDDIDGDGEDDGKYIIKSVKNYRYLSGTIDSCSNQPDYTVLGASYVGGVVGINVDNTEADQELGNDSITDRKGAIISNCYAYGVVSGKDNVGGVAGLNEGEVSTLGALLGDYALTVKGTSNVGGVVGTNDGIGEIVFVSDSDNNSDSADIPVIVKASEDKAGGIVGYLKTGDIAGNVIYSIKSYAKVTAENYAGGIAGYVEKGGSISYAKNYGDVKAANDFAGGIASVNLEGNVIRNSVDLGDVTSGLGNAGGITAVNYGILNTCKLTTATGYSPVITGAAENIGGISAVNEKSGYITKCSVVLPETYTDSATGKEMNTETVSLVDTDASNIGIMVGENEGYILGGTVGATDSATGVMGAEAGDRVSVGASGSQDKNGKDFRITYSTAKSDISLGAVAGKNAASGCINVYSNGTAISEPTLVEGEDATLPVDYSEYSEYAAKADVIRDGSAVSGDAATIANVAFTLSGTVKYLGGIVGANCGKVANASFAGSIVENESVAYAGTSYGGIAGINSNENASAVATLIDCNVNGADIEITGYYAGSSLNTSEKNVTLSSSIGGIAGSNYSGAKVLKCYITGDTAKGTVDNTIVAKLGMVGGITGANMGELTYCGYASEMDVVDDTYLYLSSSDATALVASSDALAKIAYSKIISDGSNGKRTFTGYEGRYNSLKGQQMKNENDQYPNGNVDTTNTAYIAMTSSGSGFLGGITGLNTTDGSVTYCATGPWMVAADRTIKSSQAAGVIGENDSEKTIGYNVNLAYVERVADPSSTWAMKDFYVAGVIGVQQNKTNSGWTIENCINIGDVMCYNSWNAGGVIARITYNGGTVDTCENYGTIYANYNGNKDSTVGGIVSVINNTISNQTVNLEGCENHGVVGQYFENYSNTDANAGILGEAWGLNETDKLTVNVSDCVNARESAVYGYSMATGIVAYLGGGYTSSARPDGIVLNIDRCRNYSSDIYSCENGSGYSNSVTSVSGIYGTARPKETEAEKNNILTKVKITNCFAVMNYGKNPNDTVLKGTIALTMGSQIYGYYADYRTQPDYLTGCKNNYYMDYYSFYYGSSTGNWDGSEIKKDVTTFSSGEDYQNTEMIGMDKTIDTNVTAANRLYVVEDVSASRKSTTKYKAVLPSFKTSLLTADNSRVAGTTGNEYIEAYGKVSNSDNQLSAGEIHDIGKVVLSFGDYSDHSQSVNASKNDEGDSITYDEYDSFDLALLDYYDLLDGKQLKAVTNVKLEEGNGEYKLTWNDPNDNTTYYDGAVEIYEVTNEGNTKVYSKSFTTLTCEETFNVKKFKPEDGKTYYVYAKVRPQNSAININGNLAYTYANESYKLKEVLPTPDVEVVCVNGTWYAHLKNTEDYEDYDNWSVKVTIDGSKEYTLTENTKISEINGSSVAVERGNGETSFDCYAVGKSYMNSKMTSDVIYIPEGGRFMNGSNVYIDYGTESFKVINSSEIVYSADLNYWSSENEGTTVGQVFRAELVGEDEDGVTTTILKKDVSVTHGKQVHITLDTADLDDSIDINDYNNFRVYIWYASTGAGPVYSYTEVDDSYANNVGKRVEDGSSSGYIKDVSEGEVKYYYCNPLKEIATYKTNNSYYITSKYSPITFQNNITLDDATYTYDASTDKLNMNLSWTESGSHAAYDGYELKLYGQKVTVSADGTKKVTSETALYTDYPGTGTSYSVDISEYHYDQIKVVVSGKSSSATSAGKSDEREYTPVAERLLSPDTPIVRLISEYDLKYKVTLSENNSSDMCKGESVYIKDEEGIVTKLTDTVYGESYTTVDLEEYAGQTVQIYLVSNAKTLAEGGDGMHYDSLPGSSYELKILSRLEQPDAEFTLSSNLTKSETVSYNDFTSNKSALNAAISNASDQNSYLMYGLIYKNKSDADAAVSALKAAKTDSENIKTVKSLSSNMASGDVALGFGDTVKVADIVSGTDYDISMEDYFEDDAEFSIKYADYYIVPLVRAANESKVSSIYTYGDVLHLPKTKLATPDVTKTTVTETLTGELYTSNVRTSKSLYKSTSATKIKFTNYSFDWDTYSNGYQLDLDYTLNTLSDGTDRKTAGTPVTSDNQMGMYIQKVSADALAKCGVSSDASVASDASSDDSSSTKTDASSVAGLKVEDDVTEAIAVYLSRVEDGSSYSYKDNVNRTAIDKKIAKYIEAESDAVTVSVTDESDVKTATYKLLDEDGDVLSDKPVLTVSYDKSTELVTYSIDGEAVKLLVAVNSGDTTYIEVPDTTTMINGNVFMNSRYYYYTYKKGVTIEYTDNSDASEDETSGSVSITVPEVSGDFDVKAKISNKSYSVSSSSDTAFIEEALLRAMSDEDAIKPSEYEELD